jgi:hypothetical protein
MSELVQVQGNDGITRVVDLKTSKVVAAYQESARLSVGDRVVPPPVKMDKEPSLTILMVIAGVGLLCGLSLIVGAILALVLQ